VSNWYFLRDGRQFGPCSWDDLCRNGRTGELRTSDLVWTDGMSEWKPAAFIPGIVQTSPAEQSFAPQGQAVPYFYGHPVAQKRLGDDPMMRMLLPVGRSGWAIAAGYLGLMSFLVLFAPFALTSGIVAVVDIRRHPDRHGMGRAVFGIVMGALGSAALLLVLAAAWSKSGS
jgi:hypothetical protein